MTIGATSTVVASRGPVHTGTGDQHNHLFAPSRRGARARLAVAREEQRWLLRRFIEPAHYNPAWETLSANGCVLVTGPAGSGRDATARMLLLRLPGRYVPIHDVPDRPDTPDDRPLDASAVEAGDRMLLTLTNTDDRALRTLLPRLSSYRAEVRARGAHLVIVLNPDTVSELPPDLAALAVGIRRPDDVLVLRRHLRRAGIEPDAARLADPDLAATLASVPIGTIARLAGQMRADRERQPAAGFADWLRSALATLSDQDGAAAAFLRAHPDGRQRALVLACAMLGDAPADAVHHAATALLDTTHHPPDETPALARPSFTEQLAAIGAHTDDDGRVRLDTPSLGNAIRVHFWTNFPDLRDALRDWIGTTARSAPLAPADRAALVDRFAEQALRHNRPADLSTLAARWAGHRELSAQAIRLGLRSERHGAVFRRQLYQWSVDRALPPALAGLVIRSCMDELAVGRPDAAVVRLHHLARRQSGDAGAAARAALLDLVESDDRQLRHMLGRLAQPAWPADLDLFLALSRPDRVAPLLSSDVVRYQVIGGWRGVLTGRSEQGWGRAARAWLANGVTGDSLVALLVDAGAGHVGALSRLYVVARDWAREPGQDREARGRIAAELADRIDSVQGIGP